MYLYNKRIWCCNILSTLQTKNDTCNKLCACTIFLYKDELIVRVLYYCTHNKFCARAIFLYT